MTMIKTADPDQMFGAVDGTAMCERHPGDEWPACTQEQDCPGPGTAWTTPYLHQDSFVELRRTRDASGQVLCAWEDLCTALGIERAASHAREAALQQQVEALTNKCDAWERRFRDYAGIIGAPR